MRWLTRFLGRRRDQPTLTRWLEAAAFFGVALAIRFSLGPFDAAARFLTFYPAILLAAGLLGWKEAIFVLVLSLSAGWYFFLPPGLSLLLAGWAFVGALNIAMHCRLNETTLFDQPLASMLREVIGTIISRSIANTYRC
jgi:hypothetical protein